MADCMGVGMDGVKYDQDKTRVDLVPVTGIQAAARAFGYGAKKYASWNWMGGMAWLRLYGATLRHLFAWMVGEERDPESGLSHLDHALASLMMLQAHSELNLGQDDRPPKKASFDFPVARDRDLEELRRAATDWKEWGAKK